MSILANLEHADAIARQVGEDLIEAVHVVRNRVRVYATTYENGAHIAAVLGAGLDNATGVGRYWTGTFRGVALTVASPSPAFSEEAL